MLFNLTEQSKKRNIVEILIGQKGISGYYSFILLLLIYLWYFSDILNDNVFFITIIFYSAINLYVLNLFKLGLIPIFSYFFIVGPGLTEYVIFHISDGNLNVAILAQDYITYSMVREYASASVLGGAACILGFLIASKKIKILISKKAIINPKIKKYFSYFSYFLFAITLIYFTYTQGNNMFTSGSYGAALEKKELKSPIGVLNVIFIYFLLLSFVLLYEKKMFLIKSNIIFVIFSLALLLFLASRGVRQDPFGVIIVFILIYYLSNKSKNMLKYSLLAFFLAWIFTVISGQFRYSINFNFLFQIGSSFLKVTQDGTLFFNLDTASSTVGTFHVAYINVHEFGNYLYGQSYIDWLPRTLPSFILPDRPMSLAWDMIIDGQIFALGGIQDIAEQYWNFGRLGVIIISFIIAYVVGTLSITFLQKNPFLIAIPFVFLATLPRWHWYQTFSLYKGFLTVLILAFFLHILYQIIINLFYNKKRINYDQHNNVSL